MKTNAQFFLDLLVMNGHNGDSICLVGIEEQLKKGLSAAVLHYKKYLKNAEVKKMTPSEITKEVKTGAKVLTSAGIIVKSKQNVPSLNGVLLLNENMESLVKNFVVLIK